MEVIKFPLVLKTENECYEILDKENLIVTRNNSVSFKKNPELIDALISDYKNGVEHLKQGCSYTTDYLIGKALKNIHNARNTNKN